MGYECRSAGPRRGAASEDIKLTKICLIHLYKSGQADKMAKIADLNLLVFDGEHRCQHGCNVDFLRFFSIVFAVNISFNNG